MTLNELLAQQTSKARLCKRQGYRCAYCNEKLHFCVTHTSKYMLNPRSVTQDHVIPLSRGGSNKADNIVIACRGCNQIKRNFSVPDFILYCAITTKYNDLVFNDDFTKKTA